MKPEKEATPVAPKKERAKRTPKTVDTAVEIKIDEDTLKRVICAEEQLMRKENRYELYHQCIGCAFFYIRTFVFTAAATAGVLLSLALFA